MSELQQALGLAADGTFGPQTHEAVKAVQAGAGLSADGVVGPRTWAVVRGASSSASADSGSADPGTSSGEPTLRAGDRGEAVAEAQRRLGLVADGTFGPQTHEAVETVQRAAGLPVDGVLGPRTWALLP